MDTKLKVGNVARCPTGASLRKAFSGFGVPSEGSPRMVNQFLYRALVEVAKLRRTIPFADLGRAGP